MALTVPDVGEDLLIKAMLNHTAATDLKLHLYTNDVSIAEGTTLGDVTESTGDGYAAVTLTGSSWSVTTTAGTTEASYAQQTFTYTGAEANVYGYYVTNNGSTELAWIEEFSDGSYSIPSGGGSIKVTPKIQLA